MLVLDQGLETGGFLKGKYLDHIPPHRRKAVDVVDWEHYARLQQHMDLCKFRASQDW